MIEKSSTVFLFGAGAAIAWGAPSTWELTNLNLDSGFKIKDEDITQFFHCLTGLVPGRFLGNVQLFRNFFMDKAFPTEFKGCP